MNASGGIDAEELTPEQLKQRLDTGEPLQLIDVREPYEWSICNLQPYGARLISLADLSDRMSELDRETDLVLYCRSGKRSEGAARHLRAHGFTRVWSLRGGINGWASSIDPNLPQY
jgi:adenylyltransferase/sulfurtransferase